MNQNHIIKMADLIGGATFAYGNEQGKSVYRKLLDIIDGLPECDVIGISLKGVKMTDSSFPRESVVSLAKAKRREIGFWIQDFDSKDLKDNWDYAAKAKEQPMIVISDKNVEIIGMELSTSARELFDFIMRKGTVTTSLVAQEFDITAQNASGKLKKLHEQGLIMGSKEVAETGGLEYVFKAIKKSD